MKAINEVCETVGIGASGVQKISEKSINIWKKLQLVNTSALENKKSVDMIEEVIKKFDI